MSRSLMATPLVTKTINVQNGTIGSEAGGARALRRGGPGGDHGGTPRGEPSHQPFQKLSKNASRQSLVREIHTVRDAYVYVYIYIYTYIYIYNSKNSFLHYMGVGGSESVSTNNHFYTRQTHF